MMASHSHALEKVTCGQLVVDKRSLIAVDQDETILAALGLLRKFHLLSLPVVSSSSEESSEPFVGVIDIRDILVFVSFALFQDSEHTEQESEQVHVDLNRLTQHKVKDILGFDYQAEAQAYYNGLEIVQSSTTLWEVLPSFCSGIQRVLVACQDSFRCLSEFDLIAFVALHLKEFPDLSQKTIQETGILQKQSEFNHLRTIKASDKVIKGFRDLVIYRADAIAVVERDGTLLTNLSASDLKFLSQEERVADCLDKSVRDYLLAVNYGVLREPLQVLATDSIMSALYKCSFSRCHRVWVCDQDSRPVACLRLRDILTKIRYPDA